MNDSTNDRVACPGCNKGYRWTEQMVGKTVECPGCDTRFEVPRSPGLGIDLAASVDDIYELDLGENEQHPNEPEPLAVPANNGNCPSCNSTINEGAVICMNCGFNLREGAKVQTTVISGDDLPDPPAHSQTTNPNEQAEEHTSKREAFNQAVATDIDKQHRWEDYNLPLTLLLIGVALMLINVCILAPITPSMNGPHSIGLSTLQIIVFESIAAVGSFVINSVLMFAGLLLLVRLFGTSFGEIFSVLLKIAAIVLFVAEVNAAIFFFFDYITGGFGNLSFVLNWFVYLGLMCGLSMKFLDIDVTELRVLIVFILVGRVATDYALAALILMIF